MKEQNLPKIKTGPQSQCQEREKKILQELFQLEKKRETDIDLHETNEYESTDERTDPGENEDRQREKLIDKDSQCTVNGTNTAMNNAVYSELIDKMKQIEVSTKEKSPVMDHQHPEVTLKAF